MTYDAVFARRRDEPASPKPRSSRRSTVAPDSQTRSHPVTPDIGHAVGDEFRNVLRADEERLEFAAERRGECALDRDAHRKPGVSEELARSSASRPLLGSAISSMR